jgi:hypothetical protein
MEREARPGGAFGFLGGDYDSGRGTTIPLLSRDDDVTVLTIHHTASHPPRLSFGQTLDVNAKVFGFKRV